MLGVGFWTFGVEGFCVWCSVFGVWCLVLKVVLVSGVGVDSCVFGCLVFDVKGFALCVCEPL